MKAPHTNNTTLRLFRFLCIGATTTFFRPSSAFVLRNQVQPVETTAATATTTTNTNTHLVDDIIDQTKNSNIVADDDDDDAPIIQLRLARVSDVAMLQRCNRACLPENYQDQYFLDHLRFSPKLIMVAEHIFFLPEDEESDESDESENDMNTSAPKHRHRYHHHSHHNLEERRRQQRSEIVGYVLGRVEEKPYTNRQPPPYFNAAQRKALEKFHRGIGVCPTEKFGHVASLAVMENFQRRGLASNLLRQFHYNLEAYYDDVASSGLHVRVSNEAAKKLYEKLGYQVDNRLKRYYIDREDAYFMKKTMPLATEFGVVSMETTAVAAMDPKEYELPRRLPQPEDRIQQQQQMQQRDETTVEEYITSSAYPNSNTEVINATSAYMDSLTTAMPR